MAELTERQKVYLRLVARGHTSAEIARIETKDEHPISPYAVDKQIRKAVATLGADDRSDASRRLLASELGVQRLDPPNARPSEADERLLPLPVPTEARPISRLTWWQVLAWGAIIAIATPLVVTAGAMLIEAMARMLGKH